MRRLINWIKGLLNPGPTDCIIYDAAGKPIYDSRQTFFHPSDIAALEEAKPRKKRYLNIGDPAPEGPLSGAMVSIDPATNRITGFFIP